MSLPPLNPTPALSAPTRCPTCGLWSTPEQRSPVESPTARLEWEVRWLVGAWAAERGVSYEWVMDRLQDAWGGREAAHLGPQKESSC